MPVWSFVVIWLVCGIAVALLLGHALRAIDEECAPAQEDLEHVEWPEFALVAEQSSEREVLR